VRTRCSPWRVGKMSRLQEQGVRALLIPPPALGQTRAVGNIERTKNRAPPRHSPRVPATSSWGQKAGCRDRSQERASRKLRRHGSPKQQQSRLALAMADQPCP
jgi:hypothetical protein